MNRNNTMIEVNKLCVDLTILTKDLKWSKLCSDYKYNIITLEEVKETILKDVREQLSKLNQDKSNFRVLTVILLRTQEL